MIAKTQNIDVALVLLSIEKLFFKKNQLSNLEIVGLIKEIVPEYISKNSQFEKLDKVS